MPGALTKRLVPCRVSSLLRAAAFALVFGGIGLSLQAKSQPVLPVLNNTVRSRLYLAGRAAREVADLPQTPNKTPLYAPLGKRVDIGGRSLHLNCTGKGGPTVVLEAGAGDFSLDWSYVQPGVARFARVCSYDRAGYAWSDPGPSPRTAHQIALELHTALHNAGIKGPYVLVGQSFGGFLVRAFARFYPREVVGMVLVDCLHEDSRVVIGNRAIRIREMARGRSTPPPQAGPSPPRDSAPDALSSATTTSAPHVPSEREQLGAWLKKMHQWVESQPGYEPARGGEMDWSPEDVADMYAHRDSPEYRLGEKPVIVLTRGSLGYNEVLDVSAEQLDAERKALQAELARLSTNSRQIDAAKSGHNIQYDDPDLVISAIRQVVEAARKHSKLSPGSNPASATPAASGKEDGAFVESRPYVFPSYEEAAKTTEVKEYASPKEYETAVHNARFVFEKLRYRSTVYSERDYLGHRLELHQYTSRKST